MINKGYKELIESPELNTAVLSSPLDAFTWLDFLTIIIALCALCFSFYMGHIQRKHNHLSVAPAINIKPTCSPEGFSFKLFNAGFGPAIITELKFIHKSEPNNVITSTKLFLRQMLVTAFPNEDNIENWRVSHNYEVEVVILKEGHFHTLFEVLHNLKTDDAAIRAEYYLRNFDIYIKYKCIYEIEKESTIGIIE